MATNYLDETGLAYFWTKLKSYIAGLLGLKANDADVVHKTGTESIAGEKTFTGPYDRSANIAGIIVRNTAASRGTVPAAGSYFWDLSFCDASSAEWGDNGAHGRLGLFEIVARSSGVNTVGMYAYRNVANDSDVAGIRVNIPNSGDAYATAPSTLDSRTDGDDILTRDWIPKDTRIVHTTGNETIAGTKTFTSVPQVQGSLPAFFLRNTVADKGVVPASGSSYSYSIQMIDKSGSAIGDRFGLIQCDVTSAGLTQLYFAAYRNISTIDYVVVSIMISDSTGYRLQMPNAVPSSDNTWYLGLSNRRWKDIFAVNSTIGTSDKRVKTDIANIPENVLDAWDGVSWIQYKFIDAVDEKGSNARLHTGAIAQDIDSAFASVGLDARRYGFFCYDSWDSLEPSRGEGGLLVDPGCSAGSMYSLRYVEALCIEAAYMRRENARLKKRIADLEERLAALELKIA